MTSEEHRLKANSRQNCPSNFKLYALLVFVATLLPQIGRAADYSRPSTGAYELLEKKADAINNENRTNGWAYVISGGVMLGISIPAYYLSEDVFAKVIYTVGQTLGIASVGYGSYLVLIENDYTRFQRVIKGVPELSLKERDHLAERFLEENSQRARSVRRIRVITHSLAAGLNYLDGFTSENQNLKIAYFFLAGINTVAALSFGLTKSEEENFSGSLTEKQRKASVDLIVGPVVGMRISF